ncbi:MAG: Ig-like domain-containing protein [Gemmatimonadota bacterium]|nr:Ig-like domain-containing protein [Gemmatimonadota bacterium]
MRFKAIRSVTAIIGAFTVLSACGSDVTAPDVTPASIALSTTAASLAAGSTLQLTTTVKNAGGEILTGIPVSYSSSNTSVAGVNSSGLVTATGTLGSTSITASAGTLTSAPAVITVTVGPASNIAKTIDLPASLVVGSSNTIGVKVTDQFGNPIAGTAVTFSTSVGGGSATPPTATTDASGVSTTSFKLGTTAGVNSVTASVVGVTGSPVTFSATGVAGPASNIVKAIDLPASPAAGSSNNVGVKVVDQFGNGIAGTVITFSVSSGGGAFTPATATTDASGVATTSFKLGNTVGANTATASGVGLAGSPVTFSAISVAGAAASVAKVVDLPPSPIAGSSNTVSVKVIDALGNPVVGTGVTFAVAAGSGSVSPASVNTDASGVAVASFKMGSSPGVNSVIATAIGLTNSPISFTTTSVVGPASNVVKITDLPAAPVVASSSPISVQVTDALGNPVSGIAVTFAISASDGSVSPLRVVTDATGIASANFKLGNRVGVNSATASVSGVAGSPVWFVATSVAGAAASISAVNTLPATAVVGSSLTVSARVSDAFGNPVSGTSVIFTEPAGFGTVSPVTVTTDASGIASSTLKLGSTPGFNSVLASVIGLTNQALFSTTAVAGP